MIKSLSFLYEKLWAPFFGRLLFQLSSLIEGQKINDKPTYKLTNSRPKSN